MMKKIKIGLLSYFLMLICVGFIPTQNVFAADANCADLKAQIEALDKQGTLGVPGAQVNPIKGLPEYCTINSLSAQAIKIFFYAAGGLAVVFIMIGGFQYIMGMSTGGDEAIAKAKKTITYAVIGLVIIILAGTIVIMIYNLVTGNSSGSSSNTGNSGGTIFDPSGGNGNPTSGGGSGSSTGSGGSGDTPPTTAITYQLTQPYPDETLPSKYHYDVIISASRAQISDLCHTASAKAELLLGGRVAQTKNITGDSALAGTVTLAGDQRPEDVSVVVKVCNWQINEN